MLDTNEEYIYTVGITNGTITDTANNNFNNNNQNQNYFIIKYDTSNGNEEIILYDEVDIFNTTYVYTLLLDSSNNIYIGGTTFLTNFKAFIVKYNSNYEKVWIKYIDIDNNSNETHIYRLFISNNKLNTVGIIRTNDKIESLFITSHNLVDGSYNSLETIICDEDTFISNNDYIFKNIYSVITDINNSIYITGRLYNSSQDKYNGYSFKLLYSGGDTGGGDTGSGSGDTGGGDTGGGSGDTGSGDTGSGDTGGGDTGSGDTGSGDTGGGDTGSGDTGGGDTGSGDTGGGDTGSGGGYTESEGGGEGDTTETINIKNLKCNCRQINMFQIKNTSCVKPIKTIQNKGGVKNNDYCYNTKQLLQRKCKTIEQNSFTFNYNTDTKTACANCCCEGVGTCKKVIYNPSNSQFNKQGAVSNRARLNRLRYNTIVSTDKRYIPGVVHNPNLVRDTTCKPDN